MHTWYTEYSSTKYKLIISSLSPPTQLLLTDQCALCVYKLYLLPYLGLLPTLTTRISSTWHSSTVGVNETADACQNVGRWRPTINGNSQQAIIIIGASEWTRCAARDDAWEWCRHGNTKPVPARPPARQRCATTQRGPTDLPCLHDTNSTQLIWTEMKWASSWSGPCTTVILFFRHSKMKNAIWASFSENGSLYTTPL